MGLFGRRIKDGVAAQARLTGLEATRRGAGQTGKRNVEMVLHLEVEIPGAAPVSVDHVETVPHEKSPIVGDRIPVTVSAADPSRLTIDWDAMPDLAARATASVAAARRGDSAGAAEALGFQIRKEDS